MNTKKKKTLEEIVKNWGSDKLTVYYCERHSDKGVAETVFIAGAYGNYGEVGSVIDYITDTGNGYGGTGKMLVIKQFNIDVNNPQTYATRLNSKISYWVFK
jgi:Na+-translocating ferredoxin:NAD+ oxidoreductase RnfG subunit